MAPQGPPAITPPASATGPPADVQVPASILSLMSQHNVATAPRSIATQTGLTSPTALFTGPPSRVTPPPGVTGPPQGLLPPPELLGSGGNAGPVAGDKSPFTTHHGTILDGVTSMLLVLVLGAVGGRLTARRLADLRIGADDYAAVVALVIFIAMAINQYLFAHYSSAAGGVTDLQIMMKLVQKFGKIQVAFQLTYGLLTFTVKISLLLLYRRLFTLRSTPFRHAFYFLLLLTTLNSLALLVIALTQCYPRPVSATWTHPGICLPNQTSVTVMGIVNAAIDATILVLPIRMVWTLQMSLRRRGAICGVFALGGIGVAVSIARAVYTGAKGFQGVALAFTIWSTTELAVGLVCACLPVMRPLWTKGVPRLMGFFGRSKSRITDYLMKGRDGYSKHSSSTSNATSTMIGDEKAQGGEGGRSWYRHYPTPTGLSVKKENATRAEFSKPLPPGCINMTPLHLGTRDLASGASSPRRTDGGDGWVDRPPADTR